MKWIIGNWKMNGDGALVAHLLSALADAAGQGARVVVCPPFPLLGAAMVRCAGTPLMLGAQDVSPHKNGAYTGDISAEMLKEAGCSHVIVGHSERRQYHAETSTLVAQKAAAALDAGLMPIICVGETLAQREAGAAKAVVAEQIAESIPQNASISDYLVAYEPVWAIGTGKVASQEDIDAMHTHIKACVAGVRVLYGGSVKAANARSILLSNAVDGVLVGGASLAADEFTAIIQAAA